MIAPIVIQISIPFIHPREAIVQKSNLSTGFFASLFDISFSNFVTSQLISLLYILAMIFIGIATLFGMGAGFFKLIHDFWGGMFMIIFTPLIALIYLVIVRISLELVIVIFKIADNTKEMVESQRAMVKED
jgi:uncharacterized membrane protein